MGVNKTDCGNRFIINVKCYVTTNSVWPNHVNHTRVRVCACVCAHLCTTLCDPMDYTVCKAPLSIGFPRQEYWSGLPFPSPGDLPDPGIEPMSLMSPASAGRFFTTSTTWEARMYTTMYKIDN